MQYYTCYLFNQRKSGRATLLKKHKRCTAVQPETFAPSLYKRVLFVPACSFSPPYKPVSPYMGKEAVSFAPLKTDCMRTTQPIVIIEDDRDDQETLLEVMMELGVTRPLVFFADCDDAYQYLLTQKEKPFLIFCDINLPKVNGIELKRRIDADEWLRTLCIPFVFLTTSDNPTTVMEAYGITNLQGYFRKEHSLQKIKEQVKVILDYWSWALHPNGL